MSQPPTGRPRANSTGGASPNQPQPVSQPPASVQSPSNNQQGTNAPSPSPPTTGAGDPLAELRQQQAAQAQQMQTIIDSMTVLAQNLNQVATTSNANVETFSKNLNELVQAMSRGQQSQEERLTEIRTQQRTAIEEVTRANFEGAAKLIEERFKRNEEQSSRETTAYVNGIIGTGPAMTNDLIDMIPWKKKALNWLEVSRLSLLLKMPQDKVDNPTSPYIRSCLAEMYSLLYSKVHLSPQTSSPPSYPRLDKH